MARSKSCVHGAASYFAVQVGLLLIVDNKKNNFLFSQPKHMLWVLKRTISMRRFF